MERDSIDLGTVKVSRLFRKYFIPTLIGMLNIAVATTVEGVFVGHKLGNDGIAAVNLVIPLMLLFTGIGLMLGIGCSVVASIHLAKGNVKAARINVTQAFIAGSLIVILPSLLMLIFPRQTALILGSSESLMPMTVDYLVWLLPGFLFNMWIDIGLFVIRLDGSPRVAMFSSVVAGALCVLMEWLFIFVFGWGIVGAAVGAALSMFVGAAIVAGYLVFKVKVLKFYRLKWSRKSLRISMRNIGYQSRIGSSALLGEATMVVFMFVGNHVFMSYLGDDGVGAFGIACYYMPFVFMIGNAIAQSVQPIISYNYGAGNTDRVNEAFRLSVKTAIICGVASTVAFVWFPAALVALFVDVSIPAAGIAIDGFPYIGAGFVCYVTNLAVIGYYQSVERLTPATVFAVLRGFAILVPAFLIMPAVLGTNGMWLAMPFSEIVTFAAIVVFLVYERRKACTRSMPR